MRATESAGRDLAIITEDQVRLRARVWSPRAPRGALVVAHGFGEHGGCYAEVASVLSARLGLLVVAPDMRGHGRSPGRRGVVEDYDDLTRDVSAGLAWASQEIPGGPTFLLGHSNGGQVALRAVLRADAGPGPSGLILSNPSLRLAFRVSRGKLLVGRLLRRFAPRMTLSAPLEPEKLSRDPEKLPFYLEDPLRHNRMSAPLYFGMVEGGERLLSRVSTLTLPVMMIVGGADPIVDPETCRLAFDRLGSVDKTFHLYPNMRHEPLNELGRVGVHSDLAAWLERRLPARHHVA